MTFQETNTSFIKSILKKVWFTEDQNFPILVKQTEVIFNEWIEAEILSTLSEEQMEKFDLLIHQNANGEAIYNFFVQSIPDFDNFMDSLYLEFEKFYISEYKKSLNK